MEDDFRRNRQGYTVELRKEQREGIFKRRRGAASNAQMDAESIQVENKIIIDENNRQLIENIMQIEFKFSQLEEFAEKLMHPDLAQRHRAVIGLRAIVSAGQNFELMQKIIDLGCVPVLLKLMGQKQLPQLQLQATWTLTNIACGRTTQCQSIVDKNGLEVFLDVIAQNTPHVSEQAMWGLGNIAADCPKLRDAVLNKGAMDIVLKAIGETQSVAMLQQGVWAVSILCRGTPKPKYQQIKAAIPILASLVKSGVLEDEQVALSLWAIGHHTEAQKTRIQQLIECKGFVNNLMERCRKEIPVRVLSALLRVVGNISAGNQLQTEELLRAGCLEVFTALLDHPKQSVLKEVCWIISNICVGTKSQLQQIMTCTPLLQKLAVLFVGADSQTKKEVAYVLGNICVGGKPGQVLQYVKNYSMLQSLVIFIKAENDGKCLEGGLFALFELLKVGEKMGLPNQVYMYLEAEAGFFDRLETLQSHPSTEVYKRIIQIFDNFFTVAEGGL